jgi:hypothetical protein
VPNWYMPNSPEAMEIVGHESDATTLALMGVALVVGVVGIGGAYVLYGRGPTPTVEKLVDGRLHGAYEASKHKLWFDEVYDAILVRPFKGLARGLFEIADRFVIDTVAVNGAAFVIGIFGRISRWFQNGNVQRYLVGVVVGGALVFFMTDCRDKATFTYKIVGNQLQLHAEPGSGIEGSSAKIYWDLDGDGRKDLDATNPSGYLQKRDVTVTGHTGPITMWIEDPVSRKEIKVTKTISLSAGSAGSQGGN